MPALSVHLAAATLLRVSAEGIATALVLTVQARTGHAASAGFLQTGMTLPYVLSGPVLGHVLDRTSRPRRAAVGTAAVYAVAAGTLLLVAGRVPLGVALAVAVVVGCVEPVVVGLTSLVPRFVPEERLPRAYGLEAASYSLAAISGPGLAAVVAATFDGSASGWVIAAGAVLGTLVLPFVPFGRRSAAARPEVDTAAAGDHGSGAGVFGVIGGGLRVLVGNAKLRALTAATTLAWTGWGGVPVTAVLLAQERGADASAGGRLVMGFAVGALTGSLLAGRFVRPRHVERVMFGGLVAFGVVLTLPVLAPSVSWAMAAFALAGMCEGPLFTATLMLRQRESPPSSLGQVNTTAGSLKIGATAVGATLTAACAGSFGADGLMLAIAAFQFAGAALGAALLVRGAPAEQPG
ncbi:MFS transporter [Spirillospora sp. NPDC049652]